MTVFEAVKDTFINDALSADDFLRRFEKLERNGFFWKTSELKFVVTPKSYPFIERTLSKKGRDKLRLLIVNKEQYK